MVHPDGLRFNGGQISRYRAGIAPRWGNSCSPPEKWFRRARSAQTNGPKNGQPRCPIWVAHAHAVNSAAF